MSVIAKSLVITWKVPFLKIPIKITVGAAELTAWLGSLIDSIDMSGLTGRLSKIGLGEENAGIAAEAVKAWLRETFS